MYTFDIPKFKRAYFRWMVKQVTVNPGHYSYRKLLKYLDSVPFYWLVPMDVNRAEDAYDMRQDFADSGLYLQEFVDNARDAGDASVLEVLLAFARRIDDDIMWDETQGYRADVWFWEMIENLGICINDSDFAKNRQFIEKKVTLFMQRYGDNWLFPLKKCHQDQKTMDLWMQMNRYFDENY
jgi:hypothetical protein